MNKKTFIIIGLLMCLLFAMPMVSAADANADSDLIDNSVIGSHINSQDITTSDANNIDANSINDYNLTKDSEIDIDDSDKIITDINSGNNKNSNNKNNLKSNILGEGEGTFTELNELIETATGGTLTLDKDYKFVSGTDDAFLSGIRISQSIIIDGAGHTIDASNLARIFAISVLQSGQTVKLNNLILINGNSTTSGGSIYINNIGQDAITYLENITVKDSVSGGDGGAIIITGSRVNITYSNFTDNMARARGGGIYLQNNSDTTILNSTFVNNSAGTNGGAIDFYQGAKNGRVINSTFLNNSANKTGGSIYWNGHNGVINNSIFRDNIALNQGTELNGTIIGGYGDGGAIIWSGSEGIIENSTFINNTANRRGGAIFLQGGETETCENVTVTNCTFDANIARTNGGAIDWFKGARNGHVYNSTFINNIANRTGGAIFWNGINVTIRGSNFTNNTAKGEEYGISPNGTNTTGGDGGAVMWAGPNGLIDLCNFDNNTAKWRGGAIFLQKYDNDVLCENTTVRNSNFTNNYAGSNGGAIEWTIGARYGHLINSTFENNSAARSGGAVFWYGLYGEINGSTFINNSALGNYTPGSDTRPDVDYIEDGQYCGGGLYIRGNSTKLFNDTFNDNNATRRGGAIFIYGDNNTVDNSNFYNHLAHEEGGAIYVDGMNTTIGNSTFTNNTSWDDGGAITWEGDLGILYNITCLNNSGIGNTHTSSGGTISIYGSNLTMDTINITHGYVTETDRSRSAKGGGIFLTGNNVNITNVAFEDCFTNSTADDSSGGALYVIGNNTNIVNATFTNTSAYSDGGAVFVLGENCSLNNSKFDNSVAHNDGGAIEWQGNNGKIYNLTADSCYADSASGSSKGGTLIITGNNISMDYVNVSNSYVSGENYTGTNSIQGGGIFLTGNECNITNSKFVNCSVKDNKTDSNGGALYVMGNKTNLINTTVESSNAVYGGGVYWSGHNGTISNSNFTKNNSTINGSAIYLSGNEVILSNSTLNDNNALNGSAAFYCVGHGCEALDSNFTNNIANKSGGALYWNSGNAGDLIDGCIFTNNTSLVDNTDKSKTQGGGAVFWSQGGNGGIIRNSEFYNNSVQSPGSGSLGGAVIWDRSYNGLIDNCTFTGNYISATDLDADDWVQGGAVYWRNRNGTISNSYFSECYSDKEAGAIYYSDQDGGYDSNAYGHLVNCTFENNYAKALGPQNDNYNLGGGAVLLKESLNLEITNCSFINNTHPRYAGALGVSNSANNISVNNCTFENNSAVGDAGAINWASANGIINNTQFINNTAGSNGGALRWTTANGILDNSTFINNTASGEGGAVHWNAVNATIGNSTFINNTASGSGGALRIQSREATLNNLSFENNSAISANGGAIYTNGDYTIIKNSSFVNNNASGNGGAILYDANHGNLYNSTFINNTASGNGGAVQWNKWNGTIVNSTFDNNSAIGNGGALVIGATYCVVDNANFTNNNASGNGGALSWTGANGNITNSNFVNSTSLKQGGAVFTNAGNLKVINDSFINSSSGDSGGAIYLNSANAIVNNSEFINNSAINNISINANGGGAIYSPNSGVKILNSNFTNNSIPFAQGGALLLTGNDVLVNNSQFYNNTNYGEHPFKDESLGGAAWITGQRAVVDNSIFEGNAVYGTKKWLQGGALGLTQPNAVLNNSYFKDNFCLHEGGALYFASNGGKIENSTFISNVANGTADGSGGTNDEGNLGGGAIYIKSQPNIVIKDTIIANNSANTGAGVLSDARNQNRVTFDNCTIENNTGLNGAGVYLLSGKINFTDSRINSNIATGDGGGLYIGANAANNCLLMDNLTLFNNTAIRGGAIFINKNALSFANFTAFNNTAELGGAIYWASANSGDTISNATMQYNKAEYGSAIYFNASNDVNLVNVVLLDNQALALRFTEMDGTVTDSSLVYSALFEGGDNILNAIYNEPAARNIYYTNVTYWGVLNNVGTVLNTGETRITATKRNPVSGETGIFQSSREAGQNVTLILYDQDNNVVYNVTKETDIAGNVTFNYEGQNVNLMPIRLIHYEDDYYTEISFATKNMTNVIIEVNDINYTETELVNITIIPAIEGEYEFNPTGNITVYINDELYGTYTLDSESKYQLSLPDLEVGNYTIRVDYKGDINFLGETNESEFNVFKIPSHIDVAAQNITFNQIDNITVILPDYNASGKLVITITNKTNESQVIRTLEIEDFKNTTGVIYPFEGLKAGNYTVKAVFSDDHNYYGSEDSDDFEVAQADPNLREVSPDIIYGNNETITVSIDGGATGTITVKVGEDIIGTFTIAEDNITEEDKSFDFNYAMPIPGTYNLTVIYDGDNNYYNDTVYGQFIVSKAVPQILIDVDNIFVGDNEYINITVQGVEDGAIPTGQIKVIVKTINGNYTLNVTGQYNITVINEDEGPVSVTVIYYGDDYYNNTDASVVYNVTKRNTTTAVTGQTPITYGDIENLTVTVNETGVTGTITIFINSTVDGFENITKVIELSVDDEGEVKWNINGKALPVGQYNVTTVFSGDNKFYGSNGTYVFVVGQKEDYNITVEANNTVYRNDQVIIVNVPEDANGTVTITIAGTEISLTEQAVNGKAVFTIPNDVYDYLEVHEDYNVTATYNGDANYAAGKTADDLFNVTKADSEIIVIPTDINYKETEPMVINITVANASGKVNVTIVNKTSGEEIDSWIIDSIISGETPITYTAKILEAGNYTVKVEYYGDPNYNNDTDEKDFEVRKINTTISEVSPDIVYGNDETITVTIGDSDATGTVVVKVGDIEIANKTIGQDELVFVIEKPLADPQYNITVIYSGDNNYNDATITGTFAVNKTVPTIDLDINNIFVGENEVINVTVIGIDGLAIPTGNVTILVRSLNETRILNTSAGASLTLENEVEGTGVTVIVFYNGDNNYNATSISKHYNVTKRNTTTAVTGQTPIPYGAIENLTITVNETAITGTVTIYINSTVAGFENITKVFTITEANHNVIEWNIDEKVLKSGEYNVTAVYSGDDKYYGSNGTYTFVVEKASDYEISVEANNTVYRQDQVIIVNVPEDANGTVTITIAGTDISLTEQALNGKAVFTIPSGLVDFLEVHDDYNVTATYNGDDNYLAGQTADDLFNVTKADSHIDVEAQNITYSQIENITVSLPDINASGRIVITINNSSGIVRTQTVDVFTTTDGVIYPFADLASGNYTVKVVYSDDHNYNDSEDSYDFEVAKADPTLSENSPDIVYGNNENITVIITGAEGALVPTGTIEVKVDGVTVDTIEIGNALEYIVTKPVVDPRHNVTVVYSGDSNYNDATIYGEFAVSQNDTYEFEEDSPNIVYANNETITITLPNDATGTVYLVVNGSYYTPIGIDDNHQAVFNISSPIVGEYAFTAYYSGDSNYVAKDISGAFNVTKADVNLAETHTATITYGADNTIIVTIEGVENGLDPTGTIVVKVDDVEIGNQTIGTDGLVFVLEKPIVDPVHNITVIYSGDNNYNDKTITGTFEVIKNTTVDLSENSPDIFYLENETVTVTIAGDATGTITVKLGEETIGIVTIANDNITEDDKEFSFTIVKPDGGVYDNLTVVYGGDTNYETKTITGAFTVSPIDPNITEDSPDIVYGANETITITVPDGASGTLIVKVSNASGIVKEQSLIIGEDNLEVTLEKPAVGNYTISIEYSGCDNYTAKTVEGAFEVTKASNEITVVPTNITYGDSETITVTVPEDATGTVTITIGDYTDTKEITAGSATVEFTIPKAVGEDILEVNNNYIVFANYSGDSNYQSVIAYAPFHVSPANTTTTVRVENITYGKDEIINVTVTGVPNGEIPRGFVTITINGTDISLTKAVDSEGNAQFNVSGLIAGEYTVNASFVSSSLNYTNSVGNASFNVTKADVADFNETTNNNITAANITYGDDETITIEFAEKNITGNVTIKINGVEVETKALDNGKVTFTIPNGLFDYLEANEYRVVANYSGDDNYNAKEGITAEFKVDKSNVTVAVDPIDIIYKEIETINVTVTGVIIDDEATGIAKYNLTGKVTIYIDDVENQTLDISQADANGVLHFNVEGLAVGPHNVTAKYWNDVNYNDKNATSDFNVANALPEDMKVIPQNITYHIESENITIDLGEVLNGTLVVYLNGSEIYNAEVIDKDQIKLSPIENLAVGNYTVRAVFIANDDSVDANASFEVRQAPTTVTVDPINISYGQIENITVYVDNALEDKFNLTGSVTIYINGREVETKAIGADGKVIFNVEGLAAADDYIVEARYHNDVNYLNSTGTGLFNVTKANVADFNNGTSPELNNNITSVNITYNDDETITLEFGENNIIGNVTITINGVEIETKALDNGKVVFTVKDLEVNNYTVIANYSGDSNYNAKEGITSHFTVSKDNSTINVVPSPSIVYGNNETVNITVPIRNHTGTITLTINGTDYQFIKHLTAEDGDSITLNDISGLAVGIYNVTVKYDNDRNYNDSEASALFEVTKATPSQITVEAQNITYTQDEIIIVYVADENATGNVTITIGDYVSEDVPIENGQAKFNVTGLVVDHYMVVANYSGDVNYTSQTASDIFRVDPAASNVTIAVENITYNDIEYANITIPNHNASGRVIIKVDGKAYDIRNIDNNTPINLALEGLAVGEHYIDVEYFDDVNYNKSIAHAAFNVTKADIPDENITVVPTNITYLDNETITVTVDVPNATGKVTIRINGTDVELSKNITEEGSQTVTFTVPGLVVGNYNVTVEYSDDANYNDKNVSAVFKVSPANSTINLEVVNITYLDNETITVTVPITNASGTIVTKVNGTVVDETSFGGVDNPVITIYVPGLAVGEYNVTAEYFGDANYEDADASALFNVTKAESSVIVDAVPSIVYNDNETITVTVPITNASGTIVTKVNGTVVDETSFGGVDNPVITIYVPGLAVGEYNVTAEYFGDANYEDADASALFNVTKAESSIDLVAVPSIVYNDNETITVTVPIKNASGTLITKVNDTIVDETDFSTVDNPSITIYVPGLAVGTYNVTVEYYDDPNYNNSEAEASFVVTKDTIPTDPDNESSLKVIPEDIVYLNNETIEVSVGVNNATGIVTIFINGTEMGSKNITSEGSQTVHFTVPDLAVGEYNVTAKYTDDVNYEDAEVSDLFNVTKAQSDLEITVENITYGDNETIAVTVPIANASGTLVIKVNGSEINRTKFNGEDSPVVEVLVEKPAAGEYNVTVEYIDDVNYENANSSAIYTVSKANPIGDVNITATNVTYGENVTVTVTVPEDASGNVTITIGDYTETKEISSGTNIVTFTVPDLEVNNYVAYANYSGDNNYNSSLVNVPFHVDKAQSHTSVSPINISYNDDETITVVVSDDNATGFVSIKIEGTDVELTKAVDQDGTAIFTVKDLVVGDYTVNAVYHDDRNYNDSSASSTFSVNKAEVQNMTLSPVNITYGDNETITVTIADNNISGNVSISVNGTEYGPIELDNGRAVFTVPGLTVGDYEVVASYSGDDNYNASTANGEFSVDKAEASVIVVASDIDYGDDETITVIVDGLNVTGNVTIKVNGTEYDTKEIDNRGRAVFTIPGLKVGEYEAVAVYNGDDNHISSQGSDPFTVSRITPDMNVTVENITYGDNETITVNLPEDATGAVNITIDSVTYPDVPIVKGTATITVPGITPGEHDVTVDYPGDDNYNGTTITSKFDVDKANATVDVGTVDIDYGDNETVTVTVESVDGGITPTGTVNITITDSDGNKITYTDVPLEDGVAKVTVPGLDAGDYDVDVTYSGDTNYNDGIGKGEFSVGKVVPDMDVNTQNITYGDNETITVSLPEDATGTVNITITDKYGNKLNYTDVPLTDGKAVIEVPDLAAGNYTVDAKYSGDENYDANSTSGTFEVAKAVPHIEIHVYDIIYGDVEVLTVSCDAPGYVEVTVNGITVTISLDDGHEKRLFASILRAYNGKATLELENLAVGTYPATAVYRGNENYTSVNDTDTFHVIKANTTTQISVDDIKVGEDAVINVEVSHDSGSEKINTNITVTVDGKNYTVELIDGKGTLTVSDLSAGEHIVSATFPGDHNYTESSNTTSFKASKVSPSFDVESENIKVGDDETVTVSLPEDATGNVTITIDGKKYTAPVINGTATFKIPGIKAGNHTVNAEYSGDDKYAPAKGKDTFTVYKVKPSVDVDSPTIKEGEDGVITVTLPDDATGTVTIEIDGRNYTARIKDGKAVFNIPGLSPGKHNIKIYYSGDDKYLATITDGGEIDVIANEHNKSDNGSKQKGIDLESKATGNPILVLMLVLFSLILIPIKRLKDDEEDESR